MNNDAAPIVEAGGFHGYCEDFEYAWRWEIRRDGVVDVHLERRIMTNYLHAPRD